MISAVACALVLAVSNRVGAFDSAAAAGQAKIATRPIPNTGGIGLFAGIAAPLVLAVIAAWVLGDASGDSSSFMGRVAAQAAGVRSATPMALVLLGSMAVIHVLGIVDDRRPLGPVLKLSIMLVTPLPIVTGMGLSEPTRLLEMLDGVAGGSWLSIAVTVLWFAAVTNALNFIDNMDGLAGGVTAVAGAAFLAAALLAGQWFVAGMLALVVGSCLGFLVFNKPPARLFMGDGGSLVLGFVLAFLTARTTYVGTGPTGEPLSGAWYGVFMPLLVLAVPLYDMVSVVVIRVSQGRSPMVGDLQHLSHRLVKRGLTRGAAVGVVCGLTAVTALGGVILGRLPAWGACVVAGQTAVLLAVVAVLEWSSSPKGARRDSLEVRGD